METNDDNSRDWEFYCRRVAENWSQEDFKRLLRLLRDVDELEKLKVSAAKARDREDWWSALWLGLSRSFKIFMLVGGGILMVRDIIPAILKFIGDG